MAFFPTTLTRKTAAAPVVPAPSAGAAPETTRVAGLAAEAPGVDAPRAEAPALAFHRTREGTGGASGLPECEAYLARVGRARGAVESAIRAAEGARDYAALRGDLELFAHASSRLFDLHAKATRLTRQYDRADHQSGRLAQRFEAYGPDYVEGIQAGREQGSTRHLEHTRARARSLRILLDPALGGEARRSAEADVRADLVWLAERTLGEGRLMLDGSGHRVATSIGTPAGLVQALVRAHDEMFDAWKDDPRARRASTPYSDRAAGVAFAAASRGDLETAAHAAKLASKTLPPAARAELFARLGRAVGAPAAELSAAVEASRLPVRDYHAELG